MTGTVGSSPIPLDSLSRSRGTFESAIGLPPAVYSDAEFHQFELQAVFGSEWLCVGRVEQLTNVGDFISTKRAGEPIIVVRSSDNELSAMSAVCQHRGMCVTAEVDRGDDDVLEPVQLESGNTRRFRCPYHWWTYGLDGALLGAPEMDRTTGFDSEAAGLPPIAVEAWQGFVFVNFDINASPLGPSLRKLDEVLQNHHLDELITVDPVVIPDVPFNWKIMVENFMEMYHNSRLHRGIHDFAPSSAAWYEDYEPGDGALFGFTGTREPDGGFNPTYKALFPPLPDTTDDERKRVIFAFVAPSLLLGVQSDSAFWFTVDPTGPESHDLGMAYLFPKSTIEMDMFDHLLESAIQGVGHFNRQDLPTNVATQAGMKSRFAPRGNYSWQEGVLPHFNTWLVERYENAD
jgi:phenylpropionate dioxygenase-like ring-hydroxylating dioxygenase large terminal subunit